MLEIKTEVDKITKKLNHFIKNSHIVEFNKELTDLLNSFNNQYFPSPDFKYKLRHKQINEYIYAEEKEKKFLKIYSDLVKKFNIKLKQDKKGKFIDKWFLQPIRDEIEIVKKEIEEIKNEDIKDILRIILSRTVRSCRATTHSDLATLKDPVITPYYCSKHGKICKPLFSIIKWWTTYTNDTIKRLAQFDKLRTDTYQICLTGDSRKVDILKELENKNPLFAEIVKKQGIKGIFSSPPYIGLIDYHGQHAYAYDLFNFKIRDELEIGPLFKGQGKEARDSYIEGISDVLVNCKKYLVEDFDIFLVVNDKYNLYPLIV